jgi:hypothetical protein
MTEVLLPCAQKFLMSPGMPASPRVIFTVELRSSAAPEIKNRLFGLSTKTASMRGTSCANTEDAASRKNVPKAPALMRRTCFLISL